MSEFFAITCPTIVVAFSGLDIIYMTTRGGPGSATSVPSYQVYNQAFGLGQVGMAATIGVTLAVVIFGVNLVLNRLADKAVD